jgi:CheY-like chemotaxis protein
MEAMDSNKALPDIVDWLAEVEEKASAIYSKAAMVFAADKQFSAFLQNLSEEEAEHHALLSEAAGRMAQEAMAEACFVLDETLRQGVEAPFDRAHALLKKGGLTKAAMLGIIAESEFSEWNEIFLYVMDTLKGQGREFQRAVAEIDQHRLEIEAFITAFPRGERILQKIGRLSPLWTKRILVVEDDPAIANLIKSLFRTEAEVVLAEDGKQGLERIQEGYFNVVVSDVEMPNLNGIELYQQALAVDPGLKKHFVFYSGTRKPEHREFFAAADIVMLPKPAPLSRLRKVINEVAALAD